jgi:hypothetical protein
MLTFDKNDKDAHKKFIEWIQENPTGHVINSIGKRVMLHRSTCAHFRPYEGYGRANNPKHCSPKRGELETWATNRDLLLCRTCM